MDRQRIDVALIGGDPDFDAAVGALLRKAGFMRLTDGGREALVAALAGTPTPASAQRLQLLAEDEGFQFLHGAEARHQAEETVRGDAFPDAAEIAHLSGTGRPAHEPHGALQWIELGLHAMEGLEGVAEALAHGAHGLTAAAAGVFGEAAVAAGLVALPIAVVGGLHEIVEAHEAGERWGGAVQYGEGFVDQLEAELRGDEPLRALRGPRAEGAAQARTFWTTLEPSERVAIREAASDEMFRGLRRCVEAITIGGGAS